MKKIIVTGGAGFIGSNFVHLALENDNLAIVNLDKLTYAGNLENLTALEGNPKYSFVKGDIGDRDLVTQLLLEHRPEAVVNFAAESHVDRSIDGPEDFIQTNMVGTFHLLDSVRAYWDGLQGSLKDSFRFLHVSTDEVYGSLNNEDPAFTEESPYQPNSPYSASKAASDHLVRAYHHTYGLPVLTTNCSNNYGPYQFTEKLIPLIISNALKGKDLPIYGDGKNIRDWLYVVDHCAAVMKVLNEGTPGEVYNIGGNYEKTNIEIVNTICAILDELVPNSPHRPHKNLITFVEDRLGHDHRYAINTSKIERDLEWSQSETFESGIQKTVKWYLENGAWVESALNGKKRN